MALFERPGDELERNAVEGTIWNERGSKQPTSRKCDRNKMQSQRRSTLITVITKVSQYFREKLRFVEALTSVPSVLCVSVVQAKCYNA